MFKHFPSIPQWLTIFYILAGAIILFAAPSPTLLELEQHTPFTHTILGVAFWLYALLLLFDNHITPRKLLAYLTIWLFYVISTSIVTIEHLISGSVVPGIYLALTVYIFMTIFLLMAYSSFNETWKVADYIASKEGSWLSKLTRTDLRDYNEDQ